jgi:hypothetical protein
VETIVRRRQTPAGHVAGHPASAPPATGAEHRSWPHHLANPRRLANDHAVYNCHCGMVFEAPVSTSVGCPHCGGTQAW